MEKINPFKEIRLAFRDSLRQAARRLGKDHTEIFRLEKGRLDIRASTIRAYEEAYGVELWNAHKAWWKKTKPVE